ncbi:MAG: glycosyltransferase family 2 protein [Bacteroidia bacterium]
MRVSGFTIVRNAIKYDYPIKEAILSILPLCDEVIVAVGNSEDDTIELIRSIDSEKIKIIETIWDDNLREGGKVLAVETNKAFDAISKESDWAIYIQADEIMHEKYYDNIRSAMIKYQNDKNVDGLLFNYIHFYGSYDYIGDSRRWYRKEIRIIKNDKAIRSYKDAQGFRKNEKKLHVKPIDAYIYHYGWVKPPEAQQAKQKSFNKLWHNDEWMKKNIPNSDFFDYSQIDSLAHFVGEHPKVMQDRIKAINWKFSFDPTQKKLSLKNNLLYQIEKLTGWRIGEYKNYKEI